MYHVRYTSNVGKVQFTDCCELFQFLFFHLKQKRRTFLNSYRFAVAFAFHSSSVLLSHHYLLTRLTTAEFFHMALLHVGKAIKATKTINKNNNMYVEKNQSIQQKSKT